MLLLWSQYMAMRQRRLLIVGAIFVQCAHIVVYLYCFENTLHCCFVTWWLASWTCSVTTQKHNSVFQLKRSNKQQLLPCLTGNTVLLFLTAVEIKLVLAHSHAQSQCRMQEGLYRSDVAGCVTMASNAWVVMVMMPKRCLWHHDLSITILPRSLVTD